MSQHTGSHKNSLNLLGEKYLNESHWPMCQIRIECTTHQPMRVFEISFRHNTWIKRNYFD